MVLISCIDTCKSRIYFRIVIRFSQCHYNLPNIWMYLREEIFRVSTCCYTFYSIQLTYKILKRNSYEKIKKFLFTQICCIIFQILQILLCVGQNTTQGIQKGCFFPYSMLPITWIARKLYCIYKLFKIQHLTLTSNEMVEIVRDFISCLF